MTGAWDTTGLLLDRYDEVDATSRACLTSSGFLYVSTPRLAFTLLRPRLELPETRRRRATARRPRRKTSRTCRRSRISGIGQRHELAARDLRLGAAAGQQRHAHLHRHGALDPFEARQRHEDVGRDVMLLEQPQHAVAHVRRIVVRDDRSAARTPTASPPCCCASGCDGCTSITSSSCPRTIEPSFGSAGWNVSTPKSRLPCATSAPICRAGMRRTSTCTSGCASRNRAMSGSTTCTEASLAPISTRPRRRSRRSLTARFGLLGQAQQPLGVVAQEPPGVGQRGVLGGPVEQPLADALLEPPDRLADGRLGPVQLHGGPGEAPFGGNLEEDAQFAQFHVLRSLRQLDKQSIIQTE